MSPTVMEPFPPLVNDLALDENDNYIIINEHNSDIII